MAGEIMLKPLWRNRDHHKSFRRGSSIHARPKNDRRSIIDLDLPASRGRNIHVKTLASSAMVCVALYLYLEEALPMILKNV